MRSHRLLGKVLIAIAIMALSAVACGGSSTEQIREAAVDISTETASSEQADDAPAEEPATATAAPATVQLYASVSSLSELSE